MKRIVPLQLLLLLFLLIPGCNDYVPVTLEEIDTSLKAFPTAEGYGAWSRGGRGGEVYYVRNLNDSGEGSFRWACMQSGPRTVLFAVSGSIELATPVIISDPFITIAGQSAPGDGVTLIHSGIYIKTHDVIIQHIRIRPGDDPAGHDYEDRDALTIGEDSYSIMIDHVSASCGVDETISSWYAPQFITIQWSIISEGLSESFHPKKEHSKGLLVGDKTRRMSVHHNIFSHNRNRNPLVKGGAECDLVNNLIYNWGWGGVHFAIDYTKAGAKVNVIGNHFLRGLSTENSFLSGERRDHETTIYLEGNTGNDPLLLSFNRNPDSLFAEEDYLVQAPVDWNENITLDSPSIILDSIYAKCGAIYPVRDIIDARIVEDVQNGTGEIINSQDEVGGYPTLRTSILTNTQLDALDLDRDGVPDFFELLEHTDPEDPSDGNSDPDGNGYTLLEEYLQSFL